MKKQILIILLCFCCGCAIKSQEQKEIEALFHIPEGKDTAVELYQESGKIYYQNDDILQKGEILIKDKKFAFSETGEYLTENYDNLNILFVDKELSKNWVHLYEMFERQNCNVFFLDNTDFDIDTYDALVLGGGYDIDPSFYGEENKGSEDVDRAEDELQFAAIDKFVKARKPILGICRGEQLLNVYFGGSLYQDVPGHMGVYHELKVKKNTLFSEVLQTGDEGFCSHHQTVHKLGKGLVAVQKAKNDGVIEAIEHKYLPVYGGQWHPEEMKKGEDIIRLFLREVNINRLILAVRR